MSKFKVGDKVRVIRDEDEKYGNSYIGNTGRIKSDDGTNVYQYYLDSTGDRIWGDGELELVIEPTREFIVLRRDGQNVIASHKRGDEIVKTAKATCNASDAFDFGMGAKLAFDRLMGREEPKPAPKPAHRFNVGDRVAFDGGNGTVALTAEMSGNGKCLVSVDGYVNGHAGNGWSSQFGIDQNRHDCRWIGEAFLSPASAPKAEPKLYTGKVVCVEWKGNVFRHTNAGRIAIVENGICDYTGWNLMSRPFESFSDFCSANTHGVFYEIKE